MIIYVDILLFLNTVITYFLLQSVRAISRLDVAFPRLLLGSALGGLSSLTIFWHTDIFILSLLLKLLMSTLICGITFSFGVFKRLAKCTLLFFGVSFAFCGIMIFAGALLPQSDVAVNNLSVYMSISPLLLVICSCACYIIIRIIARLTARRTDANDIYDVKICCNGCVVRLDALLDSGCCLRDLYSGNPVIIVSPNAARKLIPEHTVAAFMGGNAVEQRLRLIPYSAIGGEGFLPAYEADCVTISHAGKSRECKHITIAVGKNDFNSEYSALISPELAELLQ